MYDKLNDPFAFTVFIITLLLPILIGIISMRKTKKQSDFFIGGRAMNKIVVALSAVSSGRSSWLVLGVSGMAYTLGVGAVWSIVGYITVEAFQFIFIGKKLRDETQSMDSITLLDYFESRFSDQKNLIRITGSIIITVFITAYVAAQFNAGAKTISTALDLNFALSIFISGLLILVYMVLGGYVAVAYNDVVRALIMLVGLIVLPLVGIINFGGIEAVVEILSALNPELLDPFALSFGVIAAFVGIGLGSPGQPHIVVRYMSIDDSKNLTYSAVVGTVWNVVLGIGAVSIGLLGRALVPEVSSLPENDPEMIYLILSSEYFSSIFYGLLVGGIFAAILSTADSQLLVAASTFVRDLYEKVLKKSKVIPDTDKLFLSRLVVIISGMIAMILAYTAQDLVFWLVLFAWGGLGAAFGPALILSLYWEKTTKIGIVSGMITGSLITIFWKLWLTDTTGIYELIPAFFGSLLVIVVISIRRKKILTGRSGLT
ncbi:MAG: sodium/proline symporter [Melioribacteraceae bacterium]|nr:sodium/proline symporter [Melioribacteraceae bacterium]